MKRFTEILLAVLLVASCDIFTADEPDEDRSLGDQLSHEMIVLGKQLEDPYSVRNITKAIQSLYPTKANLGNVNPTDMYVRFLPENDEQMMRLYAEGLVLMDHPLDYQILRDGDYYHDPLVAEDGITWQYAVVPAGYKLPEGIRCEVLDECYIPGPATKSDDGLDWELIEREAYRLTGNEDMLESITKADGSVSASPKGRITVVDPDANGGKPFGVAGVTVLCNSFVKYSSAVTDRDGYYEIDKKYASDVRYRLLFRNSEGFSIGFNLLLVPASMSALGKTTPEGIDCEITSASDRKLFSRAVVNNTVYDYIQRCREDDLGIEPPPSDLRLWLFQKLPGSSTPMLRHGTVLDMALFSDYLGEFRSLIATFLPDITLGLREGDTYADIYSITCHELAHASHYSKVGNDYWDKYITYILTSFVKNFTEDYGNGKGPGAGCCEVGEDWGYFMQNLLYNQRYGGAMPAYGMNYWFHPQIFRYLNERGLSVSMLFKALQSDVTDIDRLKDRLISLYPSSSSMINQVFSRYAE